MTKPKAKQAKAMPTIIGIVTQTAIPVCVVCAHSTIQGDTPYCGHPAVKAEHDPLAGIIQPTCLDERTLAPSAANRRVCGHLGQLFELRATTTA